MKKSLFVWLVLIAGHVAWAGAETAATITIVNQLDSPMERSGASFGCGASALSLSTDNPQEQIACQYQGITYYEVTLPADKLASQNMTESIVVAYATELPGYGRLGLQYAFSGKPRLGCSLVMDFTGDRVTELHIQPLYANPWVSCSNEGSLENVRLVIRAK